MGDEAEGVFEQVYEGAFERYGLNRPCVQVNSLPPFVRYTPDYLTSKSLVEVQGFGADNKVKFKNEKLIGLTQWNAIMPVMVFIYHRQTKSYVTVPLDVLLAMLKEYGEEGTFHDGKVYTSLHRRHFQWTKVYEGDEQ